MKKKVISVSICLLSVAFLFCACSPRLVSEAEAKEAGLALINQVFDVNETEAEVTYHEYAGTSYVNGTSVQYGDEEPVRVYEISIPQDDDENPLYYAAVNANTGVAYRAERNESFLSPITTDQQKQVEELLSIDIASDTYLKMLNESNASSIVADWVSDKLHPGVGVMSVLDNGFITDNVITPRVCMEYTVIFLDGAVYQASIYWPTMDILQVSILSQSIQ
jgi:hypothetical protein